MTAPAITPLDAWTRTRLGLAGDGPLHPSHLAAAQLTRLRATVAWARERSPFYRQRLAGLPAEPIADLADLARLPFTTAEDLREQPERMLCTGQGEVARIVTLHSSGTTAQPKRLFFSPADLELTLDFFHHGMASLCGPGRTVLILLPGQAPDSVGDLLARALTRLGARPLPHGPVRDPAATLAVLRASGADCLVGIPSQVLALVRHPDAAGLPRGRVRSALLTTDYVPKAVRRAVGQAWGAEVFNHYGMTELGLGGAVECAAHAGCHLRAADIYCEVIDPAGRPLPPGQAGELVFTTLNREAMPLIRYRSGDLGRLSTRPCACGSALPRLNSLHGRLAKTVDLGGGVTLTQARLDEAIFAVPGVVNFRARLILACTGRRLGLEVLTAPGAPPGRRAAVAVALAGLAPVRRALAAGGFSLEPVRLAEADWFTTGVAKRSIQVEAGD
ncbi:MAG: AMP-binding protein [Pseudomonadota bacterium]